MVIQRLHCPLREADLITEKLHKAEATSRGSAGCSRDLHQEKSLGGARTERNQDIPLYKNKNVFTRTVLTSRSFTICLKLTFMLSIFAFSALLLPSIFALSSAMLVLVPWWRR